jgi:hypothetical protein
MLEYIQTCMRKCGKATDRTLKKVLDAFDLKPEEILEYMATFVQKLNEDNALECGLEHAVEKAGEQIVEDAVGGAVKWTLGRVYSRYINAYALSNVVDAILSSPRSSSRSVARVQSADVGVVYPQKCCNLVDEQKKFTSKGYDNKSNAVAVKQKLCQFTMIRKADGDALLSPNLPDSFDVNRENHYGLMMYTSSNRLYVNGYLKGSPGTLIRKLKSKGSKGKWDSSLNGGKGHFDVATIPDLNAVAANSRPNPGFWVSGENPDEDERNASEGRYTKNHDAMWTRRIRGDRAVHHLLADNVWRSTPMLQEVLLRCDYHMDYGELLIELASTEASLSAALTPANASKVAPIIHSSQHRPYDTAAFRRLEAVARNKAINPDIKAGDFTTTKCEDLIDVIKLTASNPLGEPNFVSLRDEFFNGSFIGNNSITRAKGAYHELVP